jgi:hypothetical protein
VSDQQQSGEPPRAKRGTSRGPDPDEIRRRAAEAYGEYTTELSDAWASADPSARISDIYADYLKQLHKAASERAAERYTAAARSYFRLIEAHLDPDQADPEAYRTYIRELSGQWKPQYDASRRREAYRQYLDALSKALSPDEVERRGQEAWGRYLGALQSAWAQLDPVAEPGAVATLAQSAVAAAALMHSSREALKQRRAVQESIEADPSA